MHMKALRKLAPGQGLSLEDVEPVRAPAPGEVVVAVRAVGVCGTDLHIDEWTASYHFMAPSLPVTLGHEFSGVIRAVGEGVAGLAVGQLVSARPSTTCGVCAACVAGEPDRCTTRRGIGVARDGAFAAEVLVPARNCIPIPDGVDADVASMAEPLSVSHEAVRVGGVKPGDRVLVLGPGNIGQGIALFAREAGARQVVVAGYGDGARMQVLRRMGFADLVDFAETGGIEAGLAPYLAEGHFDVVIEATGAAAVIAPAQRALAVHGTLVITGIHAAPVPVDLVALVRNHQSVRGSYRAPEANWPGVVEFMHAHHDTLRHMVTHCVPLSRAYEAFALARDKTATKVVVQPQLDAVAGLAG
jgi:threonine dehydrogenase-like Zn-dependent dehydrogenase